MSRFFKRFDKKRLILLFFLLVVVLLEGAILIFTEDLLLKGVVLSQSKESGGYIIVLREDGFFPGEITVNLGDTVKFVTTRDEFFQPASDPHPVHNRYPTFDSKRPIPANESWSFTFDQVGIWNYHDHLSESYRGTIIVVGQESEKKALRFPDDCDGVEGNQREQCWDEMIKRTINEEGIERAFEVFAHLYATEPDFVSLGCHWTAHSVGEEAYALFLEGKDFRLTPATAYCGYGFYHGFMQFLLRDNPDMDNARAFCSYVDEQMGKQAPLSRLNCYHGIGHGFIEDPPDPELWGDPDAILEEALEVCGSVSDRPNEVEECYMGAYNGLVLFMEASQYGLSLNREDLLGFCFTQPEHVFRFCIYEFAQKLDSVADWDMIKVLGFMKDIDEEPIRQMVIGVAAAAMMQQDIIRSDNTDYIFQCRKLPDNLQPSCISGVVGGFIAHGEPEKEYIKAMDFCASSQLLKGEQDMCYNTLLNRLEYIYPQEKVEKICQSVEATFQKYCPYGLSE